MPACRYLGLSALALIGLPAALNLHIFSNKLTSTTKEQEGGRRLPPDCERNVCELVWSISRQSRYRTLPLTLPC